MSMPEREWELYAAAWRAETAPVDPAPLRRLVAAQRRRLVAVVAGEAAVLAGCAALSWWVAADGVETWELVWLATLWGFAAIASAFAFWNRRGTWKSLGESVEDHVRLARLRATRAAQAFLFGCGLIVAETVAVLAQLAWWGRLTVAALLCLAAVGAGIAGVGWLAYRRYRRDAQVLAAYTSAAGSG
jgi:hypothetical protein